MSIEELAKHIEIIDGLSGREGYNLGKKVGAVEAKLAQNLHLKAIEGSEVIPMSIEELIKHIEIIDGLSGREGYNLGKKVGAVEAKLAQKVTDSD